LSQINQDEILGRGILSLLVITGVAFSGITFFMLDDGLQTTLAEYEVKSVPTNICENGLCGIENSEGISNIILVQQGVDISSTDQVIKNDDFSNLQLVKSPPVKEFEKSGNKVTLFAEKDSFIREGIQNTNEGSNEVLRIMGAGLINNRALISFNLDDIQEVSSGKTLQSATIKLYVEKNNLQWNDGQYISIHNLLTQWDEGNGVNAPVSNLIRSDGVTWNCPVDSISCNEKWNGGIFNENPSDSIWISNQVDDYWIKFDVTSDIYNYQEANENFGWIIMKDDEGSDGQINIASREAKSNNPELVMVFSDE
jgi:hypothetical protein